MSTFSGLNVAGSALNAARRGLDVTGQNIANVSTDGYSRQRAELQSVGPGAVPAVWSKDTSVGNGVTADAVTRIRDTMLDRRAYTEHAAGAQLAVADAAFTDIQAAFQEPGSSGIQAKLSAMWNAWSDLANNPTDAGTRTAVLTKTQTLVDGITSARGSLDAQWDRTRDSLVALTAAVNSTAASIAGLNRSIQEAAASGQSTNDLADKRDALVLQLAGQVGATAQTGAHGAVDVFVGGTALVSGSTALGLTVAGPAGPDAMTNTDLPRLVTSPGGAVVAAGGTAGGQLTALGVTIRDFRSKLDTFAQDLARQVNGQNKAGRDATGAVGAELLGPLPESTITAANLALVVSDPRALAAAQGPPDASGPSTDHLNADAMAQQPATGTADASYRSLVVGLGVQASAVSRALETQNTVVQQVDADRESVSGVNLDEEMTNMLSYQHMYAAAGRLVTAIDEMLDVLINRTGMVGRG